jgi:hypothetical protein
MKMNAKTKVWSLKKCPDESGQQSHHSGLGEMSDEPCSCSGFGKALGDTADQLRAYLGYRDLSLGEFLNPWGVIDLNSAVSVSHALN